MYGDFEAVIGLEIHAQLLAKSKLFSTASAEFGAGDNENVTFLDAGMPGTLPVLNKGAVALAVKTGLALNCDIQNFSVFARKQYFYPDMPKGYQISQFDKPICAGGYVEFYVDGEKMKVHLERAHMEEDAGKSTHHGEYTLVNLNRSGVPLLEIVSKPEMHTPQQAAEYARAVRQILRYTGVCDGNLQEGSMRCDCNVSVRKKGDTQLGTKVELKNINSFRFVEKAIDYEIHRQIDCVQNSETIVQETRLYDSTKNKTFSMRTKEEADDYRYFPDPDLLPLTLDDHWVSEIKNSLPELPLEKSERFQSEYGLPVHDATLLTSELELGNFFEQVVKECNNAKLASNWMMSEMMGQIKETDADLTQLPITPQHLAEMIKLIDNKTISGKMAKDVFIEMWKTGKKPELIVKESGMEQITDQSTVQKLVDQVLADNQDKVDEYKAGKDKLYGFFVGQVMKLSKGQASPEVVNKLLRKGLGK